MQKEQHRICEKCSSKETRLVDEANWIFLDGIGNFLSWNDPCKKCANKVFSERGESFVTDDPKEMIISNSSAEIWLKDDTKWIRPDDEYVEFMYLDILIVLSWIDRSDITNGKRNILIEALCHRLDFEIEINENEDTIRLLTQELQKRKEIIEINFDRIDPCIIEIIAPRIGITNKK